MRLARPWLAPIPDGKREGHADQGCDQVYQLGRAFTALTLVEGTVNVARKHALQVIHVEQALHIFVEREVQTWFLTHPTLMHWINRVYSFIHIPGTILFLVVLYYFTTTRRRRAGQDASGPAGPALYEARRRTMALCNLIAFVVFTLWPCMPPRLLSDPDYHGDSASEAKSFGFVDTVHSKAGESSVWTTNKFCNQYGEYRPGSCMFPFSCSRRTGCAPSAIVSQEADLFVRFFHL
jgi:hypothetical protein